MNKGGQEVLVLCIFSGIACAYIAKKKGRSPGKWGAFGFFIIGPIVYLLIAVIMGAIAGFSSK